MELYFRGKIVEDNGKKRLEIVTKATYDRIIKHLKLGNVTCTIEPEKKGRSISQHRFYFLYLGVIADETGDDPNSLHEYFKRKFLPAKFIKVMGKEIKVPGSTTELSKSEMVEYIMRIESETGIPAPNPEDVGFYSGKEIDYKKLR